MRCETVLCGDPSRHGGITRPWCPTAHRHRGPHAGGADREVSKRPWGGGRLELDAAAAPVAGSTHWRVVQEGPKVQPQFSVFGWANEPAPRRMLEKFSPGFLLSDPGFAWFGFVCPGLATICRDGSRTHGAGSEV